MKGFTAEELAAMRLADEEIEREFRWTNEELEASRKRDRESTLDQKDFAAQKLAEYQKAYYEANREKINEKRRRKYREKRIRNQDGV